MKKKIFIATSSFAALDPAPRVMLEGKGFEILENPYGRKLNKKELIAMLPGVIGLIAGLETIDREVMEKSNLKVISRCGSGISNIDIPAAKALGIKVYSTPGAPTTAVAEITIGALIALLRSLPQMDRDLHSGKWQKIVGSEIAGKQVAVIGFGRIGRQVGELLRAFGAKILAVDPALKNDGSDFCVVDLDRALKAADIVTIHASGDKQIIGEREFSIMKKGAYILNAARGGLIDESALCKALDKKDVAGAWLDTFEQEPYSGNLCGYNNVLLSPHIGSYSRECRRMMEMESAGNLIDALGGR